MALRASKTLFLVTFFFKVRQASKGRQMCFGEDVFSHGLRAYLTRLSFVSLKTDFMYFFLQRATHFFVHFFNVHLQLTLARLVYCVVINMQVCLKVVHV